MSMAHWWASRWARVREWLKRSGAARTPASAGACAPQAAADFPLRETYGRIARIATHALPEEDRRMQPCRCSVCGVVRLCTPDFDFYWQRPRGPLMCHDCFYQRVLGVQWRGVKA
jgi:hypothetical protein